MKFCAALLALTLLTCSSAHGAGLDDLRVEGFHSLYNLRYEEAKSKFLQMTKTDPKDPAGYVYFASTIWLNHLFILRRLQTSLYNRNDAFFTKKVIEKNPGVDKEFRETIQKGIQMAEARLKANTNDVHALYYLGVAKGAIAGYESTVMRSFFSSLRNGGDAVDLHRKVLKKDPNFVDANLSIGMYDYVVGSLPLAVKILALLGGMSGSRKDGLRELEKVAKDGHYARDEAAVILVLLYDREKRMEDSLKLLQELSAKYPRNFIFKLETARSLARLKRFPESFALFELLLQDSIATEYMPDLLHYQYADALLNGSYWQKAYAHYFAATAFAKAPESLITMARLGAGKCLDAMGKHELAKAEYNLVLQRPEAFGSHDLARAYLKNPFNPSAKY